jgi:uncharacterized protein GlcG (DUF336 family)
MKKIAFTALLVLSAALFANAQTVEKKALTIDGAKKVIAGAVAYAKKNNAPGGVIAVVDDGGNLMALERMDGTFAAGANISIGKARTAALFKRPTKVFEDNIKNGRTSLVALPDAFFTPLQGGVPITVNGQIVGAVGVSGAASAQQDEEIAMAGASVLAETKMMSHAMPNRPPAAEATIDLASTAGVALTKGEWRYSDTKIVDADFRSPRIFVVLARTNSRREFRSKRTTTRRTPAARILTIRSGTLSVPLLWISDAAMDAWALTGIASS